MLCRGLKQINSVVFDSNFISSSRFQTCNGGKASSLKMIAEYYSTNIECIALIDNACASPALVVATELCGLSKLAQRLTALSTALITT